MHIRRKCSEKHWRFYLLSAASSASLASSARSRCKILNSSLAFSTCRSLIRVSSSPVGAMAVASGLGSGAAARVGAGVGVSKAAEEVQIWDACLEILSIWKQSLRPYAPWDWSMLRSSPTWALRPATVTSMGVVDMLRNGVMKNTGDEVRKVLLSTCFTLHKFCFLPTFALAGTFLFLLVPTSSWT